MFMYSMVPILWYSLVMGAFCLPVEEDLWKSYDLVHKGLSKLLLSLFAFNRGKVLLAYENLNVFHC